MLGLADEWDYDDECASLALDDDEFLLQSLVPFDGDGDIEILRGGALPPNVSPKEVDDMLAKQMAELSLQDRESITNDVYGVRKELQETPKLIKTCLLEMDQELDKLENVAAFEMAALQDADYVQNETFRLRFLRTDLFDPKKAAWRFVQHFKVKLDLFGRELLTKDITQDDLDDTTLAALYNGFSQNLPLRDNSGRLVHLQLVVPPEIDLKTKTRMDFYMCMVKSEDDTVSRKGCVGIRFYNSHRLQLLHQKEKISTSPLGDLSLASNNNNNDGDEFQNWQAPKLLNAVPIRPSALHLCHDSSSLWSPVFAVYKYIIGQTMQRRTREHYGTYEQNIFTLQTYGIPVVAATSAISNKNYGGCKTTFPLSEDGKINTDFHKEAWMKRRNLERQRRGQKKLQCGSQEPPLISDQPKSNDNTQNAAAATSLTKSMIAPEPFSITSQQDVLLGRGKKYYEHLGNARFRYWISGRAGEYFATNSTNRKKDITRDIVELVHCSGGRFLRDEESTGWVEVDDETARLKVSHVFRNMKLKHPKSVGNNSGSGAKKRSRDRTAQIGMEQVLPT